MSSSSSTTEADNQVCLKLLIHKEKNIILYAEAGKDFVDSLFSFLTLPLADIVRLAGEESNIPAVRVGCFTTLYEGVAKLDNECLRNENCKEMLLHPRNMPMELYRQNLKLNVSGSETLNCFSSGLGCRCSSAFKNVRCCCRHLTNNGESAPSFGEFRNGLVKENNFIICDGLNVMPNSIDVSLLVLQIYGVKNMNDVLEQTVIVSKNQLLDLLKCSLLSKTPLTDVFLLKKCAIPYIHGCYQALPDELDNRQVPNDSDINFDVMVLVKKSNKKILMLQAEEDFVNLILSFLTYPLGGLLNILQRSPSSSCLVQLNESLQFFLREEKYFTSHFLHDLLAHPPCTYMSRWDKRTLVPAYLESKVYDSFYYRFNAHVVSTEYRRRITFEGFVKGPCKFMVTDDLVVKQMFSSACLSYIINGVDASAISDLEQRTLRIGLKECFSILKASLFSQSALTNGLRHHLETTIKQEKP